MTAAAQPGWTAEELVYCSNVHPGEHLAEIIHSVDNHITGVRTHRGLEQMGAGLWLSHPALDELGHDPAARADFHARLATAHTRLFTLNGFPYGGFHAVSVKQRVYRPDWSQDRRCDYTLKLAGILAQCLPADVREGTISTLPLGYRPDWSGDTQQAALQQLCRLVTGLHALYEETGRSIRVCLEMEPGCALESTPEVIAFFTEQLPRAAQQSHTPQAHIDRHLGVCYDVCHQAVMFEKPADSLAALEAAGVAIGKIQISSALEVARPADTATRRLLQDFAEPRYLHQVRSRSSDGQLHGVMDLPEGLDSDRMPADRPWRIHFHVPIQTGDLYAGGLGTTQGEIGKVLDFLAARPGLHPHLEVETYTWGVLPANLRPQNDRQLIAGLGAELDWLEHELRGRGLLRE